MATDPSELLGFQTQTTERELPTPALRLVPEISEVDDGLEVEDETFTIDPRNIGVTMLRHIEIDGRDEAVAPIFLAGVNEVIPPYTGDVYESIIATNDTEVLMFAVEGIPRALKRAIEIKKEGKNGLPNSEMDRLREMWGTLFSHSDPEVSYLALMQFENARTRLMEEDKVTYEWVGGMASRQTVETPKRYGY